MEYQICECGKRCYSQYEAGYIVNSIKRNKGKAGKRIKKQPLRVYYCRICGFNHLTSKKSYKKFN